MQIHWRKIISEINRPGAEYLLCLSAGVDSMFMLDFFVKNCAKPFRAVHFNHRLRAASNQEAEFVALNCKRLNVIASVGIGNPDLMRKADSLEAEARRQRYAFFDSLRTPKEVLVTAHHANDQIEHVFMRLMRGAPHDKLYMPKLANGRYKPLLTVPKDEIVRRAGVRGLKWIEDESNMDPSFERNWLRHDILPQLMKRRNLLKTIGGNDPLTWA